MTGTVRISGIDVEGDALHDALRALVEPPPGYRVLEQQEAAGAWCWTLETGWVQAGALDGDALLWASPIACGALADGLRYRGVRETPRVGDLLAYEDKSLGLELWTRRMTEVERASMRRLYQLAAPRVEVL